VAAFLKLQGHELVPFALPRERETIFSFFHELAGEGNMESFKDMLQGEPMVKEYTNQEMVTSLNCCLFNCIKGFTGLTQPRVAMIIEASGKLTAH
jgi:uncharacterized protein YerC